MLKICVSKENYVWSMVILGGTPPWKSTAVCKKFRRNLAVMFRAIVKWVAPNKVRALLERGDNQTKPCSIKNRRLKLRRPNMFIFWLVVLLTLRCFWQIPLWDFGCVSPCLLWGYQIRPSSSVAAVVCHYRHCLCPFPIYFTKSFWCYRLCFSFWGVYFEAIPAKTFCTG